MEGTLKVSYCTTCKGRLHHLKETLPANLAAESNNPNVEFVVLDYDSNDGLGEWIRSNFTEEIKTGRLRYARYEPAPYFKMSHAKNMAHRLATGDILYNLDADSTTTTDFSTWLQQHFSQQPKSVVSSLPTKTTNYLWERGVGRLLGSKLTPVDGKIAIRREDFEELGGYDETFTGWGAEDFNLVLRARELGLQIIKQPPESFLGKRIVHKNSERLQHLSEDDKKESAKLLNLSKPRKLFLTLTRIRSQPVPRANSSGNVGCGKVVINFSQEETDILPLHAPSAVLPAITSTDGAAPLRKAWAETVNSKTQSSLPVSPIR
jgi:hypothetical protein